MLSCISRLCTLLQPSPCERLTLCLPYSRQLTVLYQILRPGLSYGYRSPRAHHAAPSWYSELRCIPGKKYPKDQAWDQGCDLHFIGTVSATTELHWLVACACLERRLLPPCVFSSRIGRDPYLRPSEPDLDLASPSPPPKFCLIVAVAFFPRINWLSKVARSLPVTGWVLSSWVVFLNLQISV